MIGDAFSLCNNMAHGTRLAYGQLTLKTSVPARSPKLSNDEPIQ